MKGWSDMATAFILMMCVIAGMFAYFTLVSSHATPSGENAQEKLYGIGINGLVIFGGLGKSKFCTKVKTAVRRKGIVLSTMMIATIVFVVVVALVLFLLFAGVQANAGSTAGGFFYGAFDAIMRIFPGAG